MAVYQTCFRKFSKSTVYRSRRVAPACLPTQRGIMDGTTESAAPASKKRRFEQVDGNGNDEPAAASAGAAGPQADDSFDELLDSGDWGEPDEEDDDGMLPDAQDRAAEFTLSPGKPADEAGDAIAADAAAPDHIARRQSTPRRTANNDGDVQMQDIGANDQDEGEEHEDFSAHEAAILAKYGSSIANFAKLHKSHLVEPTTPGGIPANASFGGAASGFTSARGSELAPPSEASLLKARELHHSQEHAEGQESAGVSSSTRNGKTSLDDSGFAETPVQSRTSKQAGSKQALTIGRQANAKAFRPPTGVHPASTSSKPLPAGNAGQGGLPVLRYGPKHKQSLLPPKIVQVQHDDDDGADAPVQQDTPSRQTAASKDGGFAGFTSGSGAHVAMPSKEEALARMERAESGGQGGNTISSASNPAPFEGLTSGCGGTVAGPSAEAVVKVAARLAGSTENANADVVMEDAGAASTVEPTSFPGLTSGSGVAVPGPSAESLANVTARLDVAAAQEQATAAPHAGGFTTGGGMSADMYTKEAVEKALSSLDARQSTPARTSASNAISPDLEAGPCFASAGSVKPALFHSPAVGDTLKKPFKPLTVGGAGTPSRLPGSPGIGSPRIGPNGTPRISLSMQQKNTVSGVTNQKTFKTPFKNGQKPTDEALKVLASQTRAKTLEAGTIIGSVPKDVLIDLEKEKERMPVTKKPVRQYQQKPFARGKDSVFDLHSAQTKDSQSYE